MHQLQQMKPLKAQFSIDDHLGRFSKALTHLRALGLFEEVKEYVTKHHLYKEAMSLYLHEQHHLDEVINLFARHLEGQSNFAEAGQSEYHLFNFLN
jgi:elongator complex protein 1